MNIHKLNVLLSIQEGKFRAEKVAKIKSIKIIVCLELHNSFDFDQRYFDFCYLKLLTSNQVKY